MAVEYETLVQGGHSKFAEEIFKKIAPVEVESEEGNPITIVTDSAQYAKNTHLTFEPIQDLHGYDHPWPAGGGKNLLPNNVSSQTINGVTYTVNSDGSVTVNGTATDKSLFSFAPFGSFLKHNTEYIVNGNTAGGAFLQMQTALYEGIANVDDEYTWTYSSDGNIQNLVIRVDTGVAVSNQTLYPMIRLASESDATFEPYSNICPISGLDSVEVKRTGKNLFGGEANALFRLFIPSGTTVTASDLGGGNVRYYDAYQNEIDYWTLINTESVSGRKYRSFTVSSDTYFVKFDVGSTTASDFQLEVGSAPTSYKPYTEQTVTESLPETVYGGTLDLETGELVCDYGMVDLGTLSWYKNTNFNTIRFLSTTNLTNAKKPSSNVYPIKAISSRYSIFGTNPLIESSDKGIAVSDVGTISVKDEPLSGETVDAFKTAMSGVQLCYELATPITYTLTPKQLALLKGTNHINANTKSVKVTFRNGKLALMDDIPQQLAIEEKKTDEKLSGLLTILAPIENGTTASKAYTTGEYFMRDGQFCKAKTDIASGATFTLNTNYEVTTVGAELYTALNS